MTLKESVEALPLYERTILDHTVHSLRLLCTQFSDTISAEDVESRLISVLATVIIVVDANLGSKTYRVNAHDHIYSKLTLLIHMVLVSSDLEEICPSPK